MPPVVWKNNPQPGAADFPRRRAARKTAKRSMTKPLTLVLCADTLQGCDFLLPRLAPSGPSKKQLRGISSIGRALAWHARGQGFDPPILHMGGFRGYVSVAMKPATPKVEPF